MRIIKLILKHLRSSFFIMHVLSLVIVFILSIAAWAMSEKPSDSLLSSCEKSIQLYDLKPEQIISNEIGYSIHYKFADKFPSKKAFTELQRQLVKCGWKPYNALEFVVNDADWISYLEERPDKGTVMVHRFSKTFIDQTSKRLAVILVRYFSAASSLKETMQLDKPNNNIQFITLQFMPFNEDEYRKKLEEYKKLRK